MACLFIGKILASVAASAALLSGSLARVRGALAQGASTHVASFSIPKAPSGLFYYEAQDLLYVLCGTATNKDHYLYVVTTDGSVKCSITIPQAVGMTRVDGFFISGNKAYIADSQGPIYASNSGRLGGSVYEMDWTNPCGCEENTPNNFSPSCAQSTVSWSPTITTQIALTADSVSSAFSGINEGQDGSSADVHFRNSGMVVVGANFYAVNGVHPIGGSLSQSYPKSLIQGSLENVDNGAATLTKAWPFTGSTLGHDVDMEALTCGSDNCARYIYVGDEYNYIYRLKLDESDAAAAVDVEWNVKSLVGGSSIPNDKGIESLTYASKKGYFYAGIQQTSMVHVLQLTDGSTPTAPSCELSDSSASTCSVAARSSSSRRVRKDILSLTAAEWQNVVDAMWVMKNTTMDAGVARYGARFKTYDYFVVKHATAASDSRGDQGHFSDAFATFHAALCLEFENALLAVDSSIAGLPYWSAFETGQIFTADRFGSANGNTASANAVTDGKFANWYINSKFDMATWSAYYASQPDFAGNSRGYQRGSSNALTNDKMTRYGSDWSFSESAQNACAGTGYACWGNWYSCIEGGSSSGNFHSGPHQVVGSKVGSNRGDFEDPVTSPNDPVFFFHHANVDRNRMLWMENHASEKSVYYGYAGTKSCVTKLQNNCPSEGLALQDVITSKWPFTAAQLSLDDVLDAEKRITHADVLCYVGPDTAPYSYADPLGGTSAGDPPTSASGSEASAAGTQWPPVLMGLICASASAM